MSNVYLYDKSLVKTDFATGVLAVNDSMVVKTYTVTFTANLFKNNCVLNRVLKKVFAFKILT